MANNSAKVREASAMNDLQMFKDKLAKELYGQTANEAITSGLCIQCQEPALDKCYSDAGRAEYRISGLCERCFDEITKEPDPLDEPDMCFSCKHQAECSTRENSDDPWILEEQYLHCHSEEGGPDFISDEEWIMKVICEPFTTA
jgi:hypothetical protein